MDFSKYYLYTKENGKTVDINYKAFDLAEEAFEQFKEHYYTHYGTIEEDENLIAIHTGGWSGNEKLIRKLKKTAFWIRWHKITAAGGHYYFDKDFHAGKKWKIIVSED